MRVLLNLAAFIALCLFAAALPAEEISFPKSQNEIVQGLRFTDKASVQGGNGYEVKNGKTYKVINGKRYRLRGLSVASAAEVVPRVAALIYFDHNSHKISQKSHKLLDEFGEALKSQLPQSIVIVAGHTDNTGTEDYNQTLSEKRSQAVADYLIKHFGIDANRLLVRGFGESQPIASNDFENVRYKNRRVEFIRIQ